MTMRSWMRQLFTRPVTRTIRKEPRRIRLVLEVLEDRLAPAVISDTGAGGTLTFVLSPGETVAIVANATTYGFTTSGANTFTNGGVTTTADFSAFGANNITWKSTAPTTNFATLNLNDHAGANAGAAITFNDSGATNTYTRNFTVALTNASAGDITFNGTSSFTGTAALTASTTGAVTIASGATITQAAGTLSLTAGGNLTAPKVDNGTADITAPTITLKAGGTGTIGTSAANRVEINATTLNASTAGGDIFITDTAGGLAVGAGSGGGVNAGTGNVTLTAAGGSLTGPAADGTADVVGATITLAVTGVGSTIGTSASHPLEINATTELDATTAGGSIFITDTAGGLAVGEGSGGGVNAGTGNVTLTATGGSLTGPAADGTADIVGATITLNAKSGIGSSGNAVETKSSHLVTTVSDSGAVTNIAETNALNSVSATTNDGDVTINFSGGSLTFTGSTHVLSASGTATDLTFETTSGGLVVGQVSAGTGNVTLTADGGSIAPELSGSGATITITTDKTGAINGATLVAGGTGYPASTTVDLSINGGNGVGGIVAVNTNASGVATSASVVEGGEGYTNTLAAATLADTSRVTGATVTLTTTGSGNQIGIVAPVGGSSTPLFVHATTLLNASTVNGFITLQDVTGNMQLGTLNAGTAFIELTDNGAITDGNNGSGPLNLTAADGARLTTTGSNSAIGTFLPSGLPDHPIRTAIGVLTATTYDGGVCIADSNALGLAINSILAMQGGYAPYVNGSNQVVVNPNSQTFGTDNVSVTATGPILLSIASTPTAITAPNAVTISSSGVTPTGGVSIMAGQIGSNAVLAQSVSLLASGSIGVASSAVGLTVQKFSASTTNGSIYLSEFIPGTATSVVAGGSGSNASVTTSAKSLFIDTITAPTGTVTVQATQGTLLSSPSMDITGQTVDLTGKTGIGTANAPFTVTAGNLTATVTGSNDPIDIIDTTGLNSLAVTTNANNTNDTGDVAINFTGGSLAFTASTGLLTASNTLVTFDNTGGNVALGAVDAVSITASGAITANSTLTGGTVTLTAGTGIGSTPSPIDTNVTTLNATTTSGDIHISQASAFIVNATSTGTGSDIDVTSMGNMTVGTVSALGMVTLDAGGGGAILAGSVSGSGVNVSADTLELTAASGIGTSGAPLQTSVNTLTTATASGGGLFLSNNKTLSVTSASASGGDVNITTVGDLDVGSVTAAGQAVTLSAQGALIDPNGPVLNVTSQSATLSGSSIGKPGDPLETKVTSIMATAEAGVVYISDLGTGSLTLTASAVGAGSDIDFTSAGSIVLNTVSSKGNAVTLMAAGSITSVTPQPSVNITAQTLDIVAPGGIGTSGPALEVLVGQVTAADGGANGVSMDNAGPLLIKPDALTTASANGGTLTFDAASITIEELHGKVTIPNNESLLLETSAGPIVFLDPTNTIETTGAGSTITIEAGMTPGSGGVAVIGNLKTGGGGIKVTADSHITIGTLNAGTGNVTVQSANGIIINGSTGGSPNVIAGTTTLSGSAPTLRQLQLDQTEAIAAEAAAQAEAAADQSSADSFNSEIPLLKAALAIDTATETADAAAAIIAVVAFQGALAAQEATAAAEQVALDVWQGESIAADVALLIAGAAQAIPLTGDGGTAEVWADLQVAANSTLQAAEFAVGADNEEEPVVSELAAEKGDAVAAAFTAVSDVALATAELLVAQGEQADAQDAADNANVLSETDAVLATQAIAALDQGTVIGSPSNPIGIQVSGPVTVTAGPTDSFLQVTGATTVNQINAGTGSVTLISTGAVTAGTGAPNVSATGLNVSAVGGIGLTTSVSTLNASNTTSGDIVISNTAPTPAGLNITGISNTGGNVSITEGSPLTISANITSLGAISLTAAAETLPATGDDLAVNSGVTIQSTGSTVSLSAGDNVVVPSGATIEASSTTNPAITITANANDDPAGESVTVAGTLIASSASIGVDPGAHGNETFNITPSAVTPITVDGGSGTTNNTLNFNANGLAVTILGNTITAAGRQSVTFTNIQFVHILNAAGGGSITLNAAAGASDVMVLTGTGPRASTFTLNGGVPISFSGVTAFTYNGAATTETITVSPFGNSLQAWGVATTINGGTGTATLTYNDVAGLSNTITNQPSGPGAGQLTDINTGTNLSIAAVTYTQITNLVVNGSSGPGANDSLTVNGTTGADAVTIAPTTANNATITGAGPVITANAMSQIAYNGEGGNDALTVTSPAATTVTLTPGAAVDSGTVLMGTAATLLPLSYSNLGTTGTLTVANTGGTRVDTLVYKGTAANDAFTVDAKSAGGPGEVLLNNQIDVVTPGVSVLSLNGLGGIDTYSITAAPIGTLPYANINVNGSGGSTANLSGATGPVTVKLADKTPGSANPNTTITGYGGTVTLVGVDTANLDTNFNSLLVNGTSLNDNTTYTPTGTSAGTFTNAGLSTVFNFSGDTSTFTISGGQVVMANQVVTGGTANQVTVNAPAGRATIKEANRVVTVTPIGSAALEPVTLAPDVQMVNLIGGSGPDTFQVTPAAGIQYTSDGNLDNLVVNVIGATDAANDALVLQSADGSPLPTGPNGTEFVVINRGSKPNSGYLSIINTTTNPPTSAAWPDINYINIQAVSVNAPGSQVSTGTLQSNLLVNGVAISGQTVVSASQMPIPIQTKVVSASENSTTVTITTQSPHGLQAGYTVTISGFTGATAYTGTYVVASVPTPTTFTYASQFNNLAAVANPAGVGSELPISLTPGGLVQTGLTASESGTTVTITTPLAHGLVAGNYVTISGFTGNNAADYNGTWLVTSVGAGLAPRTFTYTASFTALVSATGGSEVPQVQVPVTPEPVTLTTQSPSGLQAGDSVTISGFTGTASGYNGTFVVTSALTPTTFTYLPTTLNLLPSVSSLTGVSEVPVFNLFATEPQTSTGFTQGPTPLVNSLTITVTDQPPANASNFPVYVALNITADENPGLYTVVGDQTGNAAISQVIVTDNPFVTGQPPTATVQLIFAQPLLDDRYTLTINDNVVDPAGNQLDGASNASQPGISNPFPSGSNGLPADFVARFTVNSRPHIGAESAGQQQLDINGNGFWDPVNALDAVNSDKGFAFANSTDMLFSGNFAPAGSSGTGYDELGAYGVVNGKYRWLLSFNNVADNGSQPLYSVVSTLQLNGTPVAGHFNPNINADEIALFDGNGNWYIDYDHTNNVGGPGTLVISDGLKGAPVVGDFDGSGHIEFATYQASSGLWTFDLNPLGVHNIVTLQSSFPTNISGVAPVAADMNGDGVTDIGLYVPQTGSDDADFQTAGWYWLVSQGTPTVGTINTLAHAFNPSPFSNDLYYTFGNGNELPLVGHFDPPLTNGAGDPTSGGVPIVTTPPTGSGVPIVTTPPTGGVIAPIVTTPPTGSGSSPPQTPAPGRLPNVAAALINSPEYYTDLVRSVYEHYLTREPDPQGLLFWVNGMMAGTTTDERLEAGFIGSAEYISDHGGQGAGWITGMYVDLLGRTPAASEVQGWVNELNGGARPADVAYGFAASAEREGQRVANNYTTFLGRDASAGEIAFWVDQFVNHNMSNESVVAAFTGSQEYWQKHGGDSRDWLFAAYQDILGRTPDAAGLSSWTTYLSGE